MRALPLILASLVLSACGETHRSSAPPGGESAAASFPLEVTLEDGTVLRGPHLSVSILDGADGVIQLAVDGQDEDGQVGWSAIGVAAVDDLDDGELTFAMRKLPLEDGIANVARHHGEGSYVGAEAGDLEVSLGDDGQADGVATATPVEVSAAFDGPYSVSCWVAPEALGQEPNGTGDPGGAVRIQDEDFESEFCRRFAAWR